MAGSLFGFLILFVVVVLPLAAGITMLILSRRGGLGYPACGVCKYNLSATVGTVDRCPECGAMFVDAGILPPRGKRKPALIWLGLALIILPLGCVGLFSWTVSQSLTGARARAVQARQQALAAQQAQQQQQADSDADANAQAEAETPAPETESQSAPEPVEEPESE